MSMSEPTSNLDEARVQILAADQQWAQSTTDPEKFASSLSAEANFYAPGAPAYRGAEAFARAFGELSKIPGFSLRWIAEKAEVSKSGDLGYSTGTYSATFGETTDKGKYVTIWRKQSDGSWKVIEDMFNSDLPMVPAPNQP
jgi:ketosteroid isomerase-like protein